MTCRFAGTQRIYARITERPKEVNTATTFPGYVFVRMALINRLQVLQIPGVARLAGFNGHSVPLSDTEIDGLRGSWACGVRAEPHPFLTAGCRVRITAGPLEGLQGLLIRRRGNLRAVLSIDLIQRSVAVDVDAADIHVLTCGHNS